MEKSDLKVSNGRSNNSVFKAFDPGSPDLCKLCSTEFNLSAIHMKVFHSNGKEICCAFCAMRFINRKGLLDHLDLHNDGDDLFCCYCLNEQKSDDALLEHVETHRELHVYLCFKCNRTFATKSALSGHDCSPVSATSLEVSNDLSGEAIEKGAKELVRRLVKVEQRQVRLSESTFSGSLSPKVLKSGESNRTFSVSTSNNTNNAISPERDDVKIASVVSLQTPQENNKALNIKHDVSPEKGDFDDRKLKMEDACVESRLSSVNVESHEFRDSIESTRLGSEGESLKVDFEVNQNSFNVAVEEESEDLVVEECRSGITATLPEEATVGSAKESIEKTSCQDECSQIDADPSCINAIDSLADTNPSSGSHRHEHSVNLESETNISKSSPPSSSQLEPGGGSNNLAQCPSSSTNSDTFNSCTTEAEVPQQADLPPGVTIGVDGEDVSSGIPQTLHTTSSSDPPVEKSVHTLRSRKRPLAAICDSVSEQDGAQPVQTFEEAGERILVDDSAKATSSETSTPPKKMKISFNETIEFWNPTRREKAWIKLTEEFPGVREVPLLKMTSKKSKKKSTKKRKRSLPHKNSVIKEESSEGDLTSPSELNDGFTSPVPCMPPKFVLKPVLKPSSALPVETPSSAPKVTQKGKKRVGKLPTYSDQLYEKFGPEFSYKSCLKVDGRYHCPDRECHDNNDRGYATDKGISHHMRQCHIKVPTADCNICDKSFFSKEKLKAHLMVHNPPDSYTCSICDKQFKSEYSLRYHEGLHSKPFQCYHCEKTFSRKISLKNHIVPTQCEVCQVELPCIDKFLKHEDEKQHFYRCSVCDDKEFHKLRDFTSHVRRFHYELSTALDGKWICDFCQRKFTCRAVALRHARTRHKKPQNETDNS